MRVRSLCVVMGLVAALGCGSSPPLDQGPAPSYEPEMFQAVLTYMTQPESLPVEGDWPFDQEDANQYGTAFFVRYGHAGHNSSQLDLADETTVRNFALVDEINRSLFIGKDIKAEIRTEIPETEAATMLTQMGVVYAREDGPAGKKATKA